MDHAITAREDDELWAAWVRNYGSEARIALYDIDIDALVSYRRAVRAGFFNEEVPA